MKRAVTMIATSLLFIAMTFCNVKADSLDDVLNGNTQESTQSSETPSTVSGNSSSYSDMIGIDMTRDDSGTVAKFREAVGSKVSVVVQIIVGAATFAMFIRIAIDIFFLVATFLRGLMDGGASEQMNPQQGMNGMTGGMDGMNGMGGMNGGYGMGAMGGGYGMGGYGRRGYGMNGGYGMGGGAYGMGAMGGMNGGYGMGQQMGAQQMPNVPHVGRWKIVSNGAIRAAMMDGQPDQNGKVHNMYFLYAKYEAVELIAVPVLIVLLISGAMANLGLKFGYLICDAVSSFSGGLG